MHSPDLLLPSKSDIPQAFLFQICIPGWQVEYLSTSHKAILACCGNRLQRNAGTRPALPVYTETGAKKGELCLQH